jgi:hypothetical protein
MSMQFVQMIDNFTHLLMCTPAGLFNIYGNYPMSNLNDFGDFFMKVIAIGGLIDAYNSSSPFFSPFRHINGTHFIKNMGLNYYW